ncbi:MAG: hypothetical protein ACT4OX_11105 [Actinomycetota bacterium]
MLFLHELHTVAGRYEDDFERTFRDDWVPAVADGDDARLCWYLKLAHGAGRAYQVVTITALCDGTAYERLARRVQDGDLRAWAAATDRWRHEVRGKLLLPLDWSPLQTIDLASVPVVAEHEPVLYMEDSAWPHEAKLDAYLHAARTHYAPSLEVRSERSLLTLLAVFQAALGAPRRREVVLWQRVDYPERLPGLFTHELPAHVKGPGTWMHDALEVRDDWESRLLRSASWSPLG